MTSLHTNLLPQRTGPLWSAGEADGAGSWEPGPGPIAWIIGQGSASAQWTEGQLGPGSG